MQAALAASGAEMVTVALRRADLTGKKDPFANILEFIDPEKYLLLPNTSGAMNAEEAQYGMERLLAVLAESAGQQPTSLIKHVRKSVTSFVGAAHQSDDITMLAARLE